MCNRRSLSVFSGLLIIILGIHHTIGDIIPHITVRGIPIRHMFTAAMYTYTSMYITGIIEQMSGTTPMPLEYNHNKDAMISKERLVSLRQRQSRKQRLKFLRKISRKQDLQRVCRKQDLRQVCRKLVLRQVFLKHDLRLPCRKQGLRLLCREHDLRTPYQEHGQHRRHRKEDQQEVFADADSILNK